MNILIINDDIEVSNSLADKLSRNHQIIAKRSLININRVLNETKADIMLCDYYLEYNSVFHFLSTLQDRKDFFKTSYFILFSKYKILPQVETDLLKQGTTAVIDNNNLTTLNLVIQMLAITRPVLQLKKALTNKYL